ncbi:MAG: riboflavin synthase [Acidaminococcaceae bacterium]|jgi:riboflavin synthase|nr:riboflavin synthase [Acidaminococcaceae bacterium]MCI2110510.1 riboflavin synthase [Acidaminococcaceae bacterium]
MFTGLIAELGKVDNLKKEKDSYRLTVSAQKIPPQLQRGESIAVNGACLTVTEFSSEKFTVDVMPETARRTTIGTLEKGDKVNLERTLHLSDGLDGHIVSGHIDGVGTISKVVPEGIARVVTITTPPELLRYIIVKGSIAIDGISLTVTAVTQTGFSVSLIPLTVEDTTLGFKNIGAKVNLETDIIGKYVEKMLENKELEKPSSLTKKALLENGFI